MRDLDLNIALDDVDDQQETMADQERDVIFAVEDIRKKKREKGDVMYQVKWRGLPESSNTWEPLANLESCADLINAYEERRKIRKKARKFKRKISISTAGAPSRARPMEADDDNDLSMKISELMMVNAALANNTVAPPPFRLTDGKLITMIRSVKDTVRVAGAKGRKSGVVKRFLPDAADARAAVERAKEDLSYAFKEVQKDALILVAPPFENIPITEILQPITSTRRTLNDEEDFLLHFDVKRADGSVLTVDNQFLGSNYPDMCIDYYEHRISLPDMGPSPLMITGPN